MLMASSSLSFFCPLSYSMKQMRLQFPLKRVEGSWEASRYVHYALAVVVLKGCACPLLVAMPSIAPFPTNLLASVPSPLRLVIAFNVRFKENYISSYKISYKFSERKVTCVTKRYFV
ncbi:hypothetical protein Lalb_Chr06g0168471 [Lupinus albus]|uniref:Uncharacterized protein n=1 Tax=Lupinus albus TaxID=3870 RepID=A0A6A4QDW0_LUPAL|nr:hypothetical protein Lalb_Chr06g0168471 [Lupinus albus]